MCTRFTRRMYLRYFPRLASSPTRFHTLTYTITHHVQCIYGSTIRGYTRYAAARLCICVYGRGELQGPNDRPFPFLPPYRGSQFSFSRDYLYTRTIKESRIRLQYLQSYCEGFDVCCLLEAVLVDQPCRHCRTKPTKGDIV